MLAIEAPAEVTTTLAALREEDPQAFEAVRERLRLIRSDPGHRRSRGSTFWSDDRLVRVCTVPTGPHLWAIAWTLTDSEAVHLLRIEPVDSEPMSREEALGMEGSHSIGRIPRGQPS